MIRNDDSKDTFAPGCAVMAVDTARCVKRAIAVDRFASRFRHRLPGASIPGTTSRQRRRRRAYSTRAASRLVKWKLPLGSASSTPWA